VLDSHYYCRKPTIESGKKWGLGWGSNSSSIGGGGGGGGGGCVDGDGI